MKHTPGQWVIKPSISENIIIGAKLDILTSDDKKMICTVYEDVDQKLLADPDAKLIAAAPDLLAALLAISELDKMTYLSNKWIKQAEKCNQLREYAIKKATDDQ